MSARFFGDLCDEVDIPTNGTLSRVVHSDDAVRLVLFGFDGGQELTEHTAALPVIIQVLTGTVTISLTEVSHRMRPGAWLQLDAHEPHSVVADEPARIALTMIRSG